MLAWALQQPSILQASFETYLSAFHNTVTRTGLKHSVKCGQEGILLPILFFAVERNSPSLVHLLCKAGADPDAQASPFNLSIFRDCVIRAGYKMSAPRATLLALIAACGNPLDIPKDMWEDYTLAPKLSHPDTDAYGGSDIVGHCTPEIRRALCRSLNLLQRYYLWKATLLGATTVVTRQVAEAHNVHALFQVHYHIVGQLPAAQQVINNIISHFLLQSNRPLVLLFAGMSFPNFNRWLHSDHTASTWPLAYCIRGLGNAYPNVRFSILISKRQLALPLCCQ